MKRLLGCESDEELSVDAFLDLVYEPDRSAVRRSLFAKKSDDARYRVEFRNSHKGNIRWLLDCGRAFFDESGGTPARVRGTVLDITERKQVEERQLLPMAELDHRVKNILANVGAIAKLSSKNTGSLYAVSADSGAKLIYDFDPEGVVFSFEGDIEGTSKVASAASAGSGAPATPIFAIDRSEQHRRVRILLVEDEILLGLQAQTELEAAGHKVAALATNLRQGMDFAHNLDFDFALLDIRLGDDASVPIAEKLRDRNLPFAFVTGFEDESILPAHLRSVPRFAKPYPIASILGAIDGLAAKVELEKIAS